MSDMRASIEANMQKMSSLSHTVPKIVQVVNDISSSARDLVKVIQMDPVLAAKVLKIVNSAFYGLRQEITSLNKAVILVGMNTIKNLALSTAVVNSFNFKGDECGIKSEDFWKYSVGTGVLCSLLAKEARLPKGEAEDLFIIGLLHCIGKAFFLQFYPEEYNQLIARVEPENKTTLQLESEVFGLNHCEVGGILAEKWKLPEQVVDGVKYYLDPESAEMSSTWFLSIGSSLIKEYEIGFSGDRIPHINDTSAYQKIKLSESKALQIVSQNLDAELEKANSFIKGA